MVVGACCAAALEMPVDFPGFARIYGVMDGSAAGKGVAVTTV